MDRREAIFGIFTLGAAALAMPEELLGQTNRVKKTASVQPVTPASLTSDAANVVFSNSGRMLCSKNPDEMRHFASIAKFITLTAVFDEIKKGNLKLTDEIDVTLPDLNTVNQRKCVGTGWRTIEELIERAAVHSCNDSAAILGRICAGLAVYRGGRAEKDKIEINKDEISKAGYLPGTEKAFVNVKIPQLTKKIGVFLEFDNASGLPWYAVTGGTKYNKASASTLGKIGLYMAKKHPDLFHYLAMPEIELEEKKKILVDGTVKEVFLNNTNGLLKYKPDELGKLIGVERATIEFSKTGTTKGAGSCVMMMLKLEDKGREYEFLIVTLGNASGPVRSSNVVKLAQIALSQERAAAAQITAETSQENSSKESLRTTVRELILPR